MLDIDDFKLVNDMYGHAAGDGALQKLAESMKQYFSKYVIPGRNGGNVNDYIFFHMRKADGTYISVLDHGRIVDSARNGRVFYVMIMDLNALQRHYGDCLELVEN